MGISMVFLPRGVNELSLGEPVLFRLGSFIFGSGLSSARQGLNEARARQTHQDWSQPAKPRAYPN